MRELGITEEIDESGRYDSVRARLSNLDRETQGREMRKLGAAPDYVVGSAHAITDDGQIVVGSGSGSQLGAYAYAGGNVILVIGHQKLVSDLDEGLRRVHEYSLPREYARMQGAGRPGSLLAKTLIIHYEPSARISVILVPETLGF
jgi:L-lactate utilization protein LutC